MRLLNRRRLTATLTSISCIAIIGSIALAAPATASATAEGEANEPSTAIVASELSPDIPDDRVLIVYWDGDEADLTSEQAAALDEAGVDLNAEPESEPHSEVNDELLDEAGACDIALGADVVNALEACAADDEGNPSGMRSLAVESTNVEEVDDEGAEPDLESMSEIATLSAAEAPPTTSPCMKMQWEVRYMSRTQACIANSHQVYAVSDKTGQVVGDFLLEVVTHTITQRSLVMEATNYTWLRASFATGYALGRSVTASGTYGCNTAGCETGATGFTGAIYGTWKKAQASSRFTFKPTAGVSKPLSENWTFSVGVSGAKPVKIQGLALKPRCDNNAISGLNKGCVYPQYIPTMNIPATGSSAAAGQHIAKAIASGLPSLLSRTSPAKAETNRKRSCASVASLPRIDKWQCDEYPFASSEQGGSIDRRILKGCVWGEKPGSGPGGVSVCLIPETDNNKGGALMAEFYRVNRILEGDDFRVRVP